MRKIEKIGDREDKIWDQEVLNKLCLVPVSKFIKNYSIVYAIFREKMTKVNNNLNHTMFTNRTKYTSDADT